MALSENELRFRFKFVRDGNVRGLRSRPGRATAGGLELRGEVVPYEAIGETVSRGDRLLLQVLDPSALPEAAAKEVSEGLLVLHVSRASADALERRVDRHCAALRMEAKRRAAREQGLEHLIRTEECPTCGAEVDLTELPEGAYVYCPWCDTIFDARTRSSPGRSYRTCDECGFFGRVQDYPELYFYFLLVVYGFSYKKRFLCDDCAHRLFLKATALNALFLLGLPSAVWVKIKSLRNREAGLEGLPAANRAARKGRIEEAGRLYAKLRARHRDHPGLLMNEGLARIGQGDGERGSELLGRALEACPNYHPLIRTLEHLRGGGGAEAAAPGQGERA